MFSEKNNNDIKRMNLLLNISWLGSILSFILYFYIVYNRITFSTNLDFSFFNDNTTIIFLSISFIFFIFSLYLSRKIFNDINFINTKISKVISSMRRGEENIIINSDTGISINLNLIFVCYVYCLGLLQIAPLFGLVSSLNLNKSSPIIIFSVIGLVGVFLIKPRLKNIIELSN